MTSLVEMTVEELARKIQNVKELGWVRTARRGPTGIGHTLEGLLGYAENNISIPDWGVFEVKATRKDQRNLITLISKVPKLAEGITSRKLITEHGYWDRKMERQALYCTVSATDANSLGWRMTIDPLQTRIAFEHRGQAMAFQEIALLKDALSKKIGNLVLVSASRKLERREEFFHYDEAFLLANADLNRVTALLREGSILFDWRMHMRPDGSVRDHGPGYRMFEADLPKLYSIRKKLV